MSLAISGIPAGYEACVGHLPAIPSRSLRVPSKMSILIGNFYCDLVAFLGPHIRLLLVESSLSPTLENLLISSVAIFLNLPSNWLVP